MSQSLVNGHMLPDNGNVAKGYDIDTEAQITALRIFALAIDTDGKVNASIDGNITTADDATWTMKDNSAAPLSFDVAGQAGILALDSQTGAEGVTMSGTLAVSSLSTFVAGVDATGVTSVDTLVISTKIDGIVTLDNVTIDNTTAADVVNVGGKIGLCSDSSPSATITGVVFYYDDTNIFAQNTAGEVATLNSAAFA